MLCSLFLFFYLQYTHTGGLGSGLTFILSLQFFLLFLNFANSGSYLYCLLLWQGNYFFLFLLAFGKGRVTGVTFISCHLGGVFKGWLSSRVYLHCWLPE